MIAPPPIGCSHCLLVYITRIDWQVACRPIYACSPRVACGCSLPVPICYRGPLTAGYNYKSRAPRENLKRTPTPFGRVLRCRRRHFFGMNADQSGDDKHVDDDDDDVCMLRAENGVFPSHDLNLLKFTSVYKRLED